MAPESEAAPAVETLPTGGRSRSRRSNIMVMLLVAVVGWTLWHVGQPWYAFHLSSSAEVTTGQGIAVPVSAHATVSAWQLVHPAPMSSLAAGAAATSTPASAPSSVAGVPTSAFLLAVMALLAIAGTKLRSAVLSLASLVCAWYAWGELAMLRSTVENPLAGAGVAFHLTRLPAQALYADGLALSALITLGLCGLVVVPKLVANAERANRLLSSLHEPKALEALAHSALAKVPSGLLHDAVAATREREADRSAT